MKLQDTLTTSGFVSTDSPFTDVAVGISNGVKRLVNVPGNGASSESRSKQSKDRDVPAQARDLAQEKDWDSQGFSRSANTSFLDVGQFVHDLDNLLMVIANRAELAQADVASDQRCSDSIRAIKAATKRALRLSELLRQTDADARVSKSMVNLAQVIQSTVESARAWLPTDVGIVEDLPPNTPVSVFGNFTQLQRVVQNLLSNAIDSLRSGGHVFVSLELTDKCAARPFCSHKIQASHKNHPTVSDGEVILRVGDNGAGMDAPTLARVFEPGFSQKISGPGRGLGMSIVADIINDHNGKIEIDSTVGEGTEVCIRLPYANLAKSDTCHG
ncbi:MAG: hypothetical protein DHS20C16_19570 [Phycisphaerae bacterium]|nr:MAG: hypothetical protein DHS20C16_19570 [Phycisphaerae bacterium]